MATTAINFSLETPVKLVNLPKKVNVVTFTNGLQGRASFSSEYKHLELIMQLIGIDVPKEEAANYPSLKDKRRIQLDDKDFGKAFFELYYKRSMNPDDFQWQPLKSS